MVSEVDSKTVENEKCSALEAFSIRKFLLGYGISLQHGNASG